MSSLGLSLSAHANCFTEPVKREAVHQRFHQRTVKFFRATFQEVLHHSLAEGCEPALTQALAEHFPASHIIDSTSFDCPESLANIFPGCVGAASPANVCTRNSAASGDNCSTPPPKDGSAPAKPPGSYWMNTG